MGGVVTRTGRTKIGLLPNMLVKTCSTAGNFVCMPEHEIEGHMRGE